MLMIIMMMAMLDIDVYVDVDVDNVVVVDDGIECMGIRASRQKAQRFILLWTKLVGARRSGATLLRAKAKNISLRVADRLLKQPQVSCPCCGWAGRPRRKPPPFGWRRRPPMI